MLKPGAANDSRSDSCWMASMYLSCGRWSCVRGPTPMTASSSLRALTRTSGFRLRKSIAAAIRHGVVLLPIGIVTISSMTCDSVRVLPVSGSGAFIMAASKSWRSVGFSLRYRTTSSAKARSVLMADLNLLR